RAPLGMGLLEESDAADDEGTREVTSLTSMIEKTLGNNYGKKEVGRPKTPKLPPNGDDLRKMVDQLTNPSSALPAGGPTGGRKNAKGSRAAAAIPRTTMVGLQLAWEELVFKAGNVETHIESTQTENQLIKAVKAIEKKIDTLNEIEQLDDAHLEILVAVNDLRDKLVTYNDLYASYSAFSSSSGSGGGERPKTNARQNDVAPLTAPADKLNSAIQSVSDLRLGIPPVIENPRRSSSLTT
ncbi:hypothetical protein N9L68_06750, partial [bacterium]|nr:hypothetical protein [bacterium]